MEIHKTNVGIRILGSKFQKFKSGFGISTSNIPCVPIFSQNGEILIFWPKFGEIAQLRAIFWFKYCWECCRELGGGWNELGGGGWSWVEVGAWFSNTQFDSCNEILSVTSWTEIMTSKLSFQNTFILRRPRVANFANVRCFRPYLVHRNEFLMYTSR